MSKKGFSFIYEILLPECHEVENEVLCVLPMDVGKANFKITLMIFRLQELCILLSLPKLSSRVNKGS